MLPPEFYQRDTIEVARDLLGKKLVRTLPSGERLSGMIVETEAYLGADDPACHSFGNRRTPRTSVMYLSGGHAYVYFIYGMYFCFNVVTQSEVEPEAVLIRAVSPLEGVEILQRRRPAKSPDHLANGPGKLCRSFLIDSRHNGLWLQSPDLFIEDHTTTGDHQIGETHRIGLGTNEAALWPLRYFIQGHPAISLSKIV